MTRPGTSVNPDGSGPDENAGQEPLRKSFTKSERLKKQEGFDFLFKHGRSFRLANLTARFSFEFPPEHCTSVLMAAFAVPGKKFKKAVDRNRIRRRMREAWRIHNSTLKAKLVRENKRLVVWIKFNQDQEQPYSLIETETKEILAFLLKKV